MSIGFLIENVCALRCGFKPMLRLSTASFLALATLAVAQAQFVVYNSVPSPLPGNVASVGFEATSANELGDGLVLAGQARGLTTIKVIMSDWACTSGHWFIPVGTPNSCVTSPANATYSQDLTLNVYAVNGTAPGALLATQTQNFRIPYRPSSDAAHCGPNGVPGGDGEQWYNAADNSCNHGIAFPVVFDLTSLQVTLPNKIIVTISFNTTHYGYHPIGQNTACFINDNNCPYDSLNVSTDGNPTVGANVDPNGIYVNWTLPASSCSGTQSGSLQLDTPCWTGFHPEIQVNAGVGGRPFQISYVANLGVGDSVIDITNDGTLGASLQSGTTASITGAICANVYAFTPDEQLVSCCSCPVTPNGLVSLSAKNDLASNTLTPAVPTALVVKLLATVPVNGSCTSSAAAVTAATLTNGMKSFGTTIHATPAAGVYGVTERPFSGATLSAGELNRLGSLCNFILANGSGFGLCRSCSLGGLGAVRQ